MNTMAIREFHGELVRKTMIPNFIRDYLLLNNLSARDLMAESNDGVIPNTVSCERLVLTNLDTSILSSFLGYFFIRD